MSVNYARSIVFLGLTLFAAIHESPAYNYFYLGREYSCVDCNLTQVPVLEMGEAVLNVSQNRIEDATFDDRAQYRRLRELDLSYNPLKSFKFVDMHLSKLSLKGNAIESVSADTFVNTHLVNVDLSENEIANLSAIFANVPHSRLTTFVIDENRVRVLNATTVQNFHGSSISLSNNLIAELPARTFKSKHFFELNLSYNQIATIADDAFAESSIGVLNVSHNELAALTSRSLNGEMQSIDLSHNRLATLPNWLFAGQQTLRELYLNGNRFRTLDDRYFGGLIKLQRLELSANRLRAFDARVFFNLIALERLSVDGNAYTTIDATALLDVAKRLTYIDVRDNFLDCDTLRGIFLNLTLRGIAYPIGNRFNVTNVHGVPCLTFKVPLREDVTHDEFMRLVEQEASDSERPRDRQRGGESNETRVDGGAKANVTDGDDDRRAAEISKEGATTEALLSSIHGIIVFMAVTLTLIGGSFVGAFALYGWLKWKQIKSYHYARFARNDLQI